MNFPQQLLQQATARSNPFHWQIFDDLFDKVFTPAKSSGDDVQSAEPSSSQAKPPAAREPAPSVPGQYRSGRLLRNGSIGGVSVASSEDSAEAFDDAWAEALKRTKKTIVTTTKRRIIRHTPTAPPTAPRLEIPATLPASRLSRFPKTPYPRSDDSLDEGSEEESGSTCSSEELMSGGDEGLSLQVPETVLTAELHSPVRYIPPWQRETRALDMGWDTATFDMPPGLTREDIQVGFSDSWSAERVTVSWQYITTEQFVEDGKLIREKRLRNYHRTLPLPKGVHFDHVQARFVPGRLTITYPKTSAGLQGRMRPVDVLQLTR